MSSTVCGCNPAETKIFYTGEFYKDNFFISKGMEGFFQAGGNKKAAGMSRRETLVKEQIVFLFLPAGHPAQRLPAHCPQRGAFGQ